MVLRTLELEGFEPTGYLIQLNSYENRVFSIELEKREPLIAKFYRPGRWSKNTILDEHRFIQELVIEGIPAAPPIPLSSGSTITECAGMFVALFEKIKGRSPDEFLKGDLERIGRRLAQVHNVGARKSAPHRPSLTVNEFGYSSLEVLKKWVWPELWERYRKAALSIFDELDGGLKHFEYLRIHGDCHRGNLVNNGEEFFFVDFDDCVNGPTVQDIWMLAQGNEEETEDQTEELLYGYEQLRTFDWDSLELVEPLRALRLIHYSAWIARRWKDPSFPKLFPQFNTYNYWLEELDMIERVVHNGQ